MWCTWEHPTPALQGMQNESPSRKHGRHGLQRDFGPTVRHSPEMAAFAHERSGRRRFAAPCEPPARAPPAGTPSPAALSRSTSNGVDSFVSSLNLDHGVPGEQESAPGLPSGLRYPSPPLPGVRGRLLSSPATPVHPHEPPVHPRAPAARHTSPPQSVPRSSPPPRPIPTPLREHETTTTPTNSMPSPSQLPPVHPFLSDHSLVAHQDRATSASIVSQSIIGAARWNHDIAIKQRIRCTRTA